MNKDFDPTSSASYILRAIEAIYYRCPEINVNPNGLFVFEEGQFSPYHAEQGRKEGDGLYLCFSVDSQDTTARRNADKLCEYLESMGCTTQTKTHHNTHQIYVDFSNVVDLPKPDTSPEEIKRRMSRRTAIRRGIGFAWGITGAGLLADGVRRLPGTPGEMESILGSGMVFAALTTDTKMDSSKRKLRQRLASEGKDEALGSWAKMLKKPIFLLLT